MNYPAEYNNHNHRQKYFGKSLYLLHMLKA